MRASSSPWVMKLWSGLAIFAGIAAFAPPAGATVDLDGDGHLEAGDCDDRDASIWALPGEALNLSVAADKHTFSWAWASDLGGTAASAQGDLLRASTPLAFAVLGSCSSPALIVPSATDTSTPAAGHAFFYLARNRNGCGDGTLGSQSNGTPRSGVSCDCSVLCNDGQACTTDRCAGGACVHDPVSAVIQDQPESVAACPGASATFRVSGVPDGSTLHYQWKKNGLNVGTDSPVLTLSGLALADNGAHITCVVTGACAGTTRSEALLTVFPSAASCAGGGTGFEAPNGASEPVSDPGSSLHYGVAGQVFVLDATRSHDDEVVKLFSGEVVVGANDLSIAGRGMDFSWTRIYRSREGRLTAMGQNWDFSYNRYLTSPTSGTVYLFGGDSRRDTYTLGTNGCYTSVGLFRELCPQPDGTFVLMFPNRTTWTFAPLDGSPQQGRWLHSQDADANTMSATYDSAGRLTAITDTLGRPVTISYNTDGFISAVTDFGGRQVTYKYCTAADAEGMPGDLKSVTSPPVTDTPNGGDFPDGKTTTFTYTKNTGQPALDHNLLRWRVINGTVRTPTPFTTIVTNTYTPTTNPADPSFDRLQRQVFGDDPNTNIAYVYVQAQPGDAEPAAVTKTIVRDRAGNVTAAYFDSSNRMVAIRDYTGRAPDRQAPTDNTTNLPTGKLRASDPAYFRTAFTWSTSSLLTEVTLPELDKVQFTYDSANPDVRLRANLVQRKQLPGPRGGDQSSITETWTYATSFGTDPCPGPECGRGDLETQILIKNMRGRIIDMESILAARGRGPKVYQGQNDPDIVSSRTWSNKAARSSMAGEYLRGVSRWINETIKGRPWHRPTAAGARKWPCRWKAPELNSASRGGHGGGGGGGCGGMCVVDGYPFDPDIRESVGSPHGNPIWSNYTDAMGRTYSQTVDPATGHVLQASAPAVTIGTGSGGVQNIVEAWTYNSHGQVVQYQSPAGRIDTATYATSGPAAGYLDSVTIDDVSPLPGDHQALHTIVTRDQYGNPRDLQDPKGNVEHFVVNQLDQLVRHIAPAPFSYTTDYRYDDADDLVRVEEPNIDEQGIVRPRIKVTKLIAHDPFHRPISETVDGIGPLDATGGLNLRTEFVYEPNGHLTLTRLPMAVSGTEPTNTVSVAYDERDIPFRPTRGEFGPHASTTQYDYGGDGEQVAVRAGLESSPRVSTIAFDGYNRPVAETDPMGNVTTTHYDACDRVVSSRVDGEMVDGSSGPNVRLSEMFVTYDEVGRPVQVDRAHFDPATGVAIGDGFATTKTFFDPDSQVSRVEDDNGRGTDFTYDSARRLSAETTPAGSTAYTRDQNDNLLAITETELPDIATLPPQVTTTTFTVDELDRTTSVSQSGQSGSGVTHQFLWDSRSPGPVVHLDGRGNETRFVYDGANRPVETHRKMLDTGEAGGSVVSVIDETLAYDLDGRLVSRTDDNGHTTTYSYDPLGRVVTTASSDGALETMSYDVHDNPVTTTRKNGAIISANYDYKERTTSRTLVLPPNVLGPTSETYQFDGLSRVVSATNDTSHVTRSYDSLGNVTREVSGGSSIPDLTVTRVYDGAGNGTSVTYPSGLHVTTTFDASERRKTVTAEGPGVCLGGPPPHAICVTPADCGGGACTMMPPAVTTYDYVGPARVVHVSNGNGTDTSIAYDDRRRVTRTTTARTSPVVVLDDHVTAWDDSSNRTSRTEMTGSVPGTAHSYGYDSQDRLVHSVETPSGSPPVTIDYTLDGVGNRVLVAGGLDPGAYSMSSSLPEPADAQVNQYTTSPSAGACTYDAGGATLSRSGGAATLRYDYQDRLVLVSGSAGSGSFTYDALGRRYLVNGRRLVYDGMQEIEERGATGSLRRATVYGNGIDEVLSVVADVNSDGFPDRVFYHADDLGSVTAVTSSVGEKIESYDYDDYGKPRFFGPTGATLPASGIGNPVLFGGRRYDAALGLYDYRTRTMDPRTGRFLSRDSIGEWGDPWSLGNGYTYLGNNPWSGTDPEGMPKLPRSTLKSYFERGDQPTQAQFGALIDSMVNRLDDRYLLGLREYNPALAYQVGDSAIYNNPLYQARTASGYHRCGDRCMWDEDPQSCGARITKPGMDRLTSDPGAFSLSKLCPGHISCPPVMPESASSTLNDLICCASTAGYARECCERLKKALQ